SVRRDGPSLELHYRGAFRRYRRAQAADGTLWPARAGYAFAIGEQPNLLSTQGDITAGGPVKSPMPGNVLVVKVEPGEQVSAGTALVVVEAMKMEHTITA